jgi:hypothetical protein
MAFLPHFRAQPGYSRAGIRFGYGNPPGNEAPESYEARRTSAIMQAALAGLLLLSAASSWVLYTFDRWLLFAIVIVMVSLVGGLSALQGAVVLYAGVRERWR